MQNKNIKLFSLLAISAMLFACGGGETGSSNPESIDPGVSENGSVDTPVSEDPTSEGQTSEGQTSEGPVSEGPTSEQGAPTYVTEVEAEKAYKLMIDQKGVDKKLYYAGGEYVAIYYGATTEDANAAVNLVLKEAEGGYYIGYLDGTTSTFINALPNDTHNNIKFETTPKSVWTFNTEFYTLTTTCGENTVYMGTYGTHTTLSLSTVDHLGEETSYPARLYASDVATPEVVLPEEGGDIGGDTTTKTVAELLEIGSTVGEGNTTSEKYTFTGTVTAVSGREVTVTDETGSIVVYNNDTPNLYMDYEVTITGAVKDYYGVIEIVNFTLDSYVAATYEITFGAMENGTVSASKAEGIAYNEKVTLTVNPSEGYKLNELYVNEILTSVTDGTVEVTVTQDVSVEATFVTSDTVVVEKEVRTYDFSSYPVGTQYAVGEVTALDAVVTMTTTESHLNTQLRIYSSSTHNGFAVFSSEKEMYGIALNAGHSADVLNVYVSNDGTTYELFEGVNTTSAYADYSVDFGGEAYKYIKLDVAGSQQIRVASVSITIAK